MNQFIIKTTLSFVLILFVSLSYAQVKKVGAIGFTVKDMNASVKFYKEVLGFKKISDEELSGEQYEQLQGIFGLRMRVVRLQLGDETIELTDYLTSGGRSIPEDMQSNDLYFEHIAIVVSDMDKAYQHLRRYMVMHVSTGPQTIPASNAAAAGVKAFYFHDPDMHDLELIYFPADKGQAKWHVNTDKIFLGIDHTAIGVSSTENSLQFYQTLLGIERKGESFNFGTEQAHLNNIEGASLHITGLRALEGAGIEFLQYLQPGPGKPYPADTRSHDIWYWQTTLYVNDAESLYHNLQNAGYSFVSKGLVQLLAKDGKRTKVFIVKDPDGHAMKVTEVLK